MSGAQYNPVPHRDSSQSPTPSRTTFDPYAQHDQEQLAAGRGGPAGFAPYSTQHGAESLYTLPDLDDAPPPPRARFMGAAAAADGEPRVRDSLASSQFFPDGGRGSEHASSVYALRDMSPRPGVDRTSSFGRYTDDPSTSPPPLPTNYMPEKRATYTPRRRGGKRLWFILGGVAAALILIAVAVPVAITASKNKNHSNLAADAQASSGADKGDGKNGGKNGDGDPNKPDAPVLISGGDGSTITMDDGSTFTYVNKFGGTWYQDPSNPYASAAKPNSWTPALNETFTYGVDRIFGVNLGGWLNTEPFIAPALYQKYYPTAVDEWTLSVAMRADTAGGGINQLEDHYKTFITERDFAEIAGAGLNYVRIPLPYWAIEVRENEPFLAKTAWTYFLKAVEWARKYGIRINLDLHAVPGSQNGWNHSGKIGTIGWLNGPMGIANAQRSLDYIRIIAEFIAQPQYRSVVTMFGVINEPRGQPIGMDPIQRFYLAAYDIVRNATGAGNGPTISFHEAFEGLPKWQNFMPGADNIALDFHPYLCFQGQPKDDMINHVNAPCQQWGAQINNSLDTFGMTGAGEFSLAITDCGTFVNGVDLGNRYEGTYKDPDGTQWSYTGNCSRWVQWQNWDDGFKEAMNQFAQASMDSLQNWFFWTWKIGNSTDSGTVEAPAWSYKLGLENGWIPTDPRTASGFCKNSHPRTGAAIPNGSGLTADTRDAYAWPPSSINHGGDTSDLPVYTPTGSLITLPVPAATPPPSKTASGTQATATDPGSGWNNANDQAGMMVAIQGCTYLDPWVSPNTDPPSPLCANSGSSSKRRDGVPHVGLKMQRPPRPS